MTMQAAFVYASHDGHTRKIALYLADRLRESGVTVIVEDLAQCEPAGPDLAEADQIVLLAPIRYGFHLPAMDRFIHKNRSLLNNKALTVVSINLTARKEGKDTPDKNPYLQKWLKKHALRPVRTAVFAGKLNYALYRWWEQQIIRLIMKITGGPTHLDANIDFTRWDHVDELATRLVAASEDLRNGKEKAA